MLMDPNRDSSRTNGAPLAAVKDTARQERLYDMYKAFFDKAEQERRWNPLRDIPYDKIKKDAREEIAHCRFYEDVVKVLLEEDRDGTLADIAQVARQFQMPGVGIVPNYEDRVAVMREEGKVDRAVFLQKVFFPILKYLGITR